MSDERPSKQGKTWREETVDRRMASLHPSPLNRMSWCLLSWTPQLSLLLTPTHTLFPNTRHESPCGCRDCECAQGPTLSQSSVRAET